MLKWIKSDDEEHFFKIFDCDDGTTKNDDNNDDNAINENNKKWLEYQRNLLYGNFTEFKRFEDENDCEGLVVVLKKSDGIFVRLTNTSCYWGPNEHEIKCFLYSGSWQKVEPLNESIRDKRNFEYLVWKNDFEQNSFFEKNSKTQWLEYQNGCVVNELAEVKLRFNDETNCDGLVVVLKKQDNTFIKLTRNECLWGEDPARIDQFITSGSWSSISRFSVVDKSRHTTFYKRFSNFYILDYNKKNETFKTDSKNFKIKFNQETSFRPLKWTKNDKLEVRFEKTNVDEWIEFKNGLVVDESLEEIDEFGDDSDGLIIVLKKKDGTFLKLTKDECFWSNDQENFNMTIYSGGWTNDQNNNKKVLSFKNTQVEIENEDVEEEEEEEFKKIDANLTSKQLKNARPLSPPSRVVVFRNAARRKLADKNSSEYVQLRKTDIVILISIIFLVLVVAVIYVVLRTLVSSNGAFFDRAELPSGEVIFLLLVVILVVSMTLLAFMALKLYVKVCQMSRNRFGPREYTENSLEASVHEEPFIHKRKETKFVDNQSNKYDLFKTRSNLNQW